MPSPIATITVSGFRGLKELTEIAENQVKEPLESVTGVGAIDVIGGRKREIHILVDPDRLKAYGLAIRTVAEALAKQNVEFPGGRITQESGETILRTLGRVKSVREFEDIVVATNDGVPITLADIGRVEDGVEEPRSLSRYDGKNAVSLIIRKQSGSNTVAAVEAVKERLVDVRQLLPPGVEALVTRDQSDFVKSFGARSRATPHPGLAVCQHYCVFLSRQSALNPSLPPSLFRFPSSRPTPCWPRLDIPSTVSPCWRSLWPWALSLMTRLSSWENIYRYIEEKGMNAFEAARAATAEVGLAVSATTLSLVVIFIPVGFLKGIIGMWLSSFGFTMAFSIMVSLLVAFTLTPMLCSRFLPKHLDGHAAGQAHSSRESRFYRLIDRSYMAMLKWSMRHRWVIVCLTLGVFASTPFIAGLVRPSLMASDDRGEFEINVKTPPGYSLAQTDAVTRQIEEDIHPLPGVNHLLTEIGSTVGESVTKSKIVVTLVHYSERTLHQSQIMDLAREKVQGFPNLRISVDQILPVSGGGIQNVDVSLQLARPGTC